MSGGREIRTKIRSVQNTRKVTRALEMVSASKIRRAQDQMNATRPYANMMRKVIGHVARANPEYVHPFMAEHEEVREVGFILISTDRGLCGGLNMNLFKSTLSEMVKWQEQSVPCCMATLGSKGAAFFKRTGVDIKASVSHLGENPQISALLGHVKVMLDRYRNGEMDRLYLCYNRFVNTMTQQPTIDQLLPLPPSDAEEIHNHWDYLYEPDAQEVLDSVMMRYAESLVYQALLENVASEQAARMVAMKSASDNANSLIDELRLIYNKARQAAITQEISEIVGGAAAV